MAGDAAADIMSPKPAKRRALTDRINGIPIAGNLPAQVEVKPEPGNFSDMKGVELLPKAVKQEVIEAVQDSALESSSVYNIPIIEKTLANEDFTGGLFLGNAEVASNFEWIQEAKIEAIVNAASELRSLFPASNKIASIQYERLF